jgi:outer membrane protein assembly factor BamB
VLTRRQAVVASILLATGGCHDAKPPSDGRRPLWRAPFPDAYAGNDAFGVRQVVVSGGMVVASDGGSLYGFDAARGTGRWTSPFGPYDNSGLPAAPPVATGGTAVALRNQTGSAATVFGIDAASGARRWVFAGRHAVSSGSSGDPGGDFPPAVAGGLVHFATGPYLYTLDAATGAARWRHPGRSARPPMAYGGQVYVDDGRGLAALNATTGKVRWTRPSPNGGLLAAPGVVYAIADVITALDPRTGKTRWATPKGDWTRTGSTAEALRYGGQPLLAGDTICLVNGGASGVASLWALNAADGRVRWTYTAPYPLDGPVAASGDTVYCAATGGHLYALDLRTGRPRWTLDMRKAPVNPPTVVGGVVYAIIEHTTDYLYAFPA